MLRFILDNRRFLAFGLILTCFSSFGQTFFIGLFGEDLRTTFELDHGRYGLLYSIATLASGCCLISLGRQLDHIDLRIYSTFVCLGLSAACVLMGAAQNIIWLCAAIFALRITGQGLMGHTAMASMARYYDRTRGLAISVASLGFPLGEAIFATAAVVVADRVGWRDTWFLAGIIVAVGVTPFILWLLRGHGDRHARHLEDVSRAEENEITESDALKFARTAAISRTRLEVLRDPRFYFLAPAILAPACIVTGLFFHQDHLINSKGWEKTWFAACFIGFAAAQLPSTVLTGVLIDRFGAARLVRFFLIPLGLGVLTLTFLHAPIAALLFLVFAGLTSGAAGAISSAIWAELYGVKHLGAIRAMATALMVFSTASSPAIMGALIDASVSMEQISGGCAIAVLFAALLAACVRR